MSIMIVPDSIKERLLDAEEPIALCSADGTLIGYFTPIIPRQYHFDAGVYPEELDAREPEVGSRSLVEILRDLERLG